MKVLEDRNTEMMIMQNSMSAQIEEFRKTGEFSMLTEQIVDMKDMVRAVTIQKNVYERWSDRFVENYRKIADTIGVKEEELLDAGLDDVTTRYEADTEEVTQMFKAMIEKIQAEIQEGKTKSENMEKELCSLLAVDSFEYGINAITRLQLDKSKLSNELNAMGDDIKSFLTLLGCDSPKLALMKLGRIKACLQVADSSLQKCSPGVTIDEKTREDVYREHLSDFTRTRELNGHTPLFETFKVYQMSHEMINKYFSDVHGVTSRIEHILGESREIYDRLSQLSPSMSPKEYVETMIREMQEASAQNAAVIERVSARVNNAPLGSIYDAIECLEAQLETAAQSNDELQETVKAMKEQATTVKKLFEEDMEQTRQQAENNTREKEAELHRMTEAHSEEIKQIEQDLEASKLEALDNLREEIENRKSNECQEIKASYEEKLQEIQQKSAQETEQGNQLRKLLDDKERELADIKSNLSLKEHEANYEKEEALRKIETADEKISELEECLKTSEGNVTTMRGSIEALNGEKSFLEARIGSLEEELRLSNEKGNQHANRIQEDVLNKDTEIQQKTKLIEELQKQCSSYQDDLMKLRETLNEGTGKGSGNQAMAEHDQGLQKEIERLHRIIEDQGALISELKQQKDPDDSWMTGTPTANVDANSDREGASQIESDLRTQILNLESVVQAKETAIRSLQARNATLEKSLDDNFSSQQIISELQNGREMLEKELTRLRAEYDELRRKMENSEPIAEANDFFDSPPIPSASSSLEIDQATREKLQVIDTLCSRFSTSAQHLIESIETKQTAVWSKLSSEIQHNWTDKKVLLQVVASSAETPQEDCAVILLRKIRSLYDKEAEVSARRVKYLKQIGMIMNCKKSPDELISQIEAMKQRVNGMEGTTSPHESRKTTSNDRISATIQAKLPFMYSTDEDGCLACVEDLLRLYFTLQGHLMLDGGVPVSDCIRFLDDLCKQVYSVFSISGLKDLTSVESSSGSQDYEQKISLMDSQLQMTISSLKDESQKRQELERQLEAYASRIREMDTQVKKASASASKEKDALSFAEDQMKATLLEKADLQKKIEESQQKIAACHDSIEALTSQLRQAELQNQQILLEKEATNTQLERFATEKEAFVKRFECLEEEKRKIGESLTNMSISPDLQQILTVVGCSNVEGAIKKISALKEENETRRSSSKRIRQSPKSTPDTSPVRRKRKESEKEKWKRMYWVIHRWGKFYVHMCKKREALENEAAGRDIIAEKRGNGFKNELVDERGVDSHQLQGASVGNRELDHQSMMISAASNKMQGNGESDFPGPPHGERGSEWEKVREYVDAIDRELNVIQEIFVES